MDTSFDYCDKDEAYFSSDERKWINKILKLKKAHPDQVQIIKTPEENDGCIYVKLPSNWLRLSPPRKISIKDEDKAKRTEKLRLAREMRSKNNGSNQVYEARQ